MDTKPKSNAPDPVFGARAGMAHSDSGKAGGDSAEIGGLR
jgi:hypothetical protein